MKKLFKLYFRHHLGKILTVPQKMEIIVADQKKSEDIVVLNWAIRNGRIRRVFYWKRLPLILSNNYSFNFLIKNEAGGSQ